MLRRFTPRLVSVAEASALFQATAPHDVGLQGAAPLLPRCLDALAEHFRAEGEQFAEHALRKIVALDVSDADSAVIAASRVAPAQTANSPAANATAVPLIPAVMQLYMNNATIREHGCRCIANMCMVKSSAGSAGGDETSIAEELVRQRAVELGLGTMSMCSRLSAKGRCWAALAVLNLVCLSSTGADRAVKAGGEEVISDFITQLLGDERCQDGGGPLAAAALSPEATIALDAALGALARLLTMEAPDNAKGMAFRYDFVDFGCVEAMVAAAARVSIGLLRVVHFSPVGRSRLAADSPHAPSRAPSESGGSVHFAMARSEAQAAILATLPILHKCWLLLEKITSKRENLPLVFEALHEADGREALRAAASHSDAGTQTNSNRNRSSGSGGAGGRSTLALVRAALLLGAEVDGLAAIGAQEEAGLQQQLLDAVTAALVALTAPRQDLSKEAMNAVLDAAATASVSAVLPTESAMATLDVLAAGDVSGLALSTLVQLHAEERQCRQLSAASAAKLHQAHHERHVVVHSTPALPEYGERAFQQLVRSLSLLANLSESDPVARSANTIAVLGAILKDARDVVGGVADTFAISPALSTATTVSDVLVDTLFGYVPAASEGSDGDRPCLNALQAALVQVVVRQQFALIGYTFSCLWGALNEAEGREAIATLDLPTMVQQLNFIIAKDFVRPLQTRKAAYAAAATPTADHTEVHKACEEAVTRVAELGRTLEAKLQGLLTPKPGPLAARGVDGASH